MRILQQLLVIAVLVALHIGIPIGTVSLAMTIASALLTMKGATSMENQTGLVVSGAHGVAKAETMVTDWAQDSN